MPTYSDFIDRILLQPKLLEKLSPSEPISWDLPRRIREAGDAMILGEKKGDASPLRGALFYAVDALEPAHHIFQEMKGDLGSYWHGMLHRREADFDNARYWFRRAGTLPFFATLHHEVSAHWPLATRQMGWDPYLFVGECEQARFGAETEAELAKVQRSEFEVLLDYVWRQA